MMKSFAFHKHALLAAACCLCAATTHAQTVVEADTFTSSKTGTLSNRPVETPQVPGDTWNVVNSDPNNEPVSNGILTLNALGSFSKAVAPLTTAPLVLPYTLSYTLSFNLGSGNANPNPDFYGGFGNGTGNGSSFNDFVAALAFSIHTSTSGTSFTLNAGDGSSFAEGITTLPTTITRASTADEYVINLGITYNPTTQLADFFVDGTDIGEVAYNGPIAGVWFKGEGVDSTAAGYTGFQISNYSVTEAPEPSTYAMTLLGAGVLGLAVRRRRLA